ncbi:MAG: heavy-metal-associated domain-containing protein [Deltaproteobacteria bacterium]|nr:heavy-metal-associated domain-containing protein [Deltaproteobacteria bacterium]
MCGRDKDQHEHAHAHEEVTHSHDGREHRHEATVHTHEHTHNDGHHAHGHVKVKGMTCEHCVAAVTKALLSLPGVSEVRVDLISYKSAGPAAWSVPLVEVARAITAAGYEVVTA